MLKKSDYVTHVNSHDEYYGPVFQHKKHKYYVDERYSIVNVHKVDDFDNLFDNESEEGEAEQLLKPSAPKQPVEDQKQPDHGTDSKDSKEESKILDKPYKTVPLSGSRVFVPVAKRTVSLQAQQPAQVEQPVQQPALQVPPAPQPEPLPLPQSQSEQAVVQPPPPPQQQNPQPQSQSLLRPPQPPSAAMSFYVQNSSHPLGVELEEDEYEEEEEECEDEAEGEEDDSGEVLESQSAPEIRFADQVWRPHYSTAPEQHSEEIPERRNLSTEEREAQLRADQQEEHKIPPRAQNNRREERKSEPDVESEREESKEELPRRPRPMFESRRTHPDTMGILIGSAIHCQRPAGFTVEESTYEFLERRHQFFFDEEVASKSAEELAKDHINIVRSL